MCTTEIWTYGECGCRFDHQIPCHPIFSENLSPTRPRFGSMSLPATPPPSRSAEDVEVAWATALDCAHPSFSRQCSVRHIVQKVFVEPICDDCLLEELGLQPEPTRILDSRPPSRRQVRNYQQYGDKDVVLKGEEWLLESRVEIEIDRESIDEHNSNSRSSTVDQQNSIRQSIGDGDADDEGELETHFRGRSARRRGIDIARENLRIASGWSSGERKRMQGFKNELQRKDESESKKSARMLLQKIKDGDLRTFAVKAKRGFRLKLAVKRSPSKKGHTESQSPGKTEWESETAVTPIGRASDEEAYRELDWDEELARRVPSAAADTTDQTSHGPLDEYHRIDSPASISPADEITPTSISSSAAFEPDTFSSPTTGPSWDDHLISDIEKQARPKSSLTINPGCKTDIYLDNNDDEGLRLLSTTDSIASVPQTSSNASSTASWAAVTDDHQHLNQEISFSSDFDNDTGTDTDADADSSFSKHHQASPTLSPRRPTPFTALPPMPKSPPPTQQQQRHNQDHKPTSSLSSSTNSVATTFSPSPQTSPPRPRPRPGPLSLHPLTTALHISPPHRPDLTQRSSSLSSPPLRFRIEMERSATSEVACVHEEVLCAVCGVGG